jgi:hypothetical protein
MRCMTWHAAFARRCLQGVDLLLESHTLRHRLALKLETRRIQRYELGLQERDAI